jgi:DNA-nicking Smr family endonuclease
MRRRDTSKDERELFERTFAETRPVRLATTKAHAKTAVAAPSSMGGLDGRTATRLKRGLLEPDARLDLHGLTEAVAHQALLTFLRSAQTRGARLTLVVTGKGRPNGSHDPAFGRGRGILNALVPRWLREPGFAPMIAATMRAHIRHGGEGALYVYLRKPRA